MSAFEAQAGFSAAPAPKHPGWVYFIRQGNLVKIGHSTRATEIRVGELQTGNPNEIWLAAKRKGPKSLESYYHKKFRHLCVRGEWFRIDKVLSRIMAACSVVKRAPRQEITPTINEDTRMTRPELSAEVKAQVFALDCKMRRQKDPTKRGRLSLLMEMLREPDLDPAYIARQLEVMAA